MPLYNGGRIGSNNDPFTGTKSDDPNYSDVSLLLNGNGTNGSTTFTDSSVNNHTITRNGNTEISTAQSKFGGSSMYFDGAGDSLTATNSSFAFGTGQFTIEFWVRISSAANYDSMISCGNVNTSNSWQLGRGSGGTLIFAPGNSTILSTTFPSLNTWHHVAVTRDVSNVIRLFLNGTVVDSDTYTTNFSANNLKIGVNRNVSEYYHGYLDDLRITKGVARYTSNFTPPTAQLPGEVTGTFASGLWTLEEQSVAIRNELWPGLVPSIVTDGLVLHLDAGDSASYPGSGTTWTDLSGNGNNGTLVSMDGNNYSSANGGYLDFDGSSDYVQGTISSSTFTGPHSICCWFYRQTVKQWSALFSNNVNTTSCSILTFIDTSNSLGTNQTGINGTSVAAVDLGVDHLNKWIYGVITFGGVSNGSAVNVYAYKDGSLLTNSGSLYWNMSSHSSYYVGRHWASGTEVHDGFISQVTIYNKALTSSEITQNFDALKGRYGL